MVTGADRARDVSTRRNLAGYAATVLGGVVGGVVGGWAGFGAGAWVGDRFPHSGELQLIAVSLGLIVGISGGAALIVWLFLHGVGLGAAGTTAVTLGALATPIFVAASLLWGPGVETSQILVTLVGVTLVWPIVSRAVAARIDRSDARRTRLRVAAIVWIVELAVLTVWMLSVYKRQPAI